MGKLSPKASTRYRSSISSDFKPPTIPAPSRSSDFEQLKARAAVRPASLLSTASRGRGTRTTGRDGAAEKAKVLPASESYPKSGDKYEYDEGNDMLEEMNESDSDDEYEDEEST